MVDLFAQRGIRPPPRDLLSERQAAQGRQKGRAQGIDSVQEGVSNFGQGINTSLGSQISGIDLITGGSTRRASIADGGYGEGQRPGEPLGPSPLEYLRRVVTGEETPGTPPTMLQYGAEVMRGEREVPIVGGRLAYAPVTRGQELFQAGGRAVGDSVPVAGGLVAGGAAVAAPAGNVVQRGFQTLAQGSKNMAAAAPAATAGTEVAGAFGSGVGADVGKKYGGSGGELVGGLVGGIAGAASPTARVAYKSGKLAYDTAKGFLSPGEQSQRANSLVGAALKEHLALPEVQQRMVRAEELQREIPDFNPDLAQRTGSDVLDLTKKSVAGTANPADLEAMKSHGRATQEAIEAYRNAQIPRGLDSAERAFDPLKAQRRQEAEQLRSIEASVKALPREDRLMALERMALRDLQRATTGEQQRIVQGLNRVDRVSAGNSIREGINSERRRRMDNFAVDMRRLGLDQVQLTQPFREYARHIDEWGNGMLPSQRKLLPDTVQDIGELRQRDRITFADIKPFRENLQRQIRDAVASNDVAARQASFYRQQMLDKLDDMVLGANRLETPYTDASEALRHAAGAAVNPDFGKLLDSVRFARKTSKPFPTITDFLVKKGGVQDYGGELFARDIGARTRPGLYRKKGNGMRIEDAALAAWEEGYFPGHPQRPSPDDLLRAIEDDISGRPRYREGDQPAVDELVSNQEAAQGIADVLDDLGIDWRTQTPERIQARIAEMSQEPIDVSNVSDSWRDMRRRYFEDIVRPFEQGAVREIRRRDGTGYLRTRDEDVAMSFLRSADAAEQLNDIARTNPDMLRTIENVAMDELASAAVSNGRLTPRQVEKFAERYRPALSRLPNVQKAVDGLTSRLRTVEQRAEQGRAAIQQRRQQASNEIALERQRLKETAQPILERMGYLHNRVLAEQDTALAQAVSRMSRGAQSAESLIREGLRSPDLMRSMVAEVGKSSGANAATAINALRRHVWDDMGGLSGEKLTAYMTKYQESLGILLGKKHMRALENIRDALIMTERSPVPSGGQPIRASFVDRIRQLSGMDLQQMASRYVNVQSGRLSSRVASFDAIGRWLSERNTKAMDNVLRKALYDSAFAEELLKSARRQGGVPTQAMMSWLWRLGLAVPEDDQGPPKGPTNAPYQPAN